MDRAKRLHRSVVARKRRKELKTMVANRTANFFAKLRKKRRSRTA